MILDKKNLLKFILITAYLSAVLRPSIDSNITLFRLLLPLTIVLIYQVSASYAWNLLKASIVVTAVSMLQFAITKYILFPELDTLTWMHQVVYLVHIISLLVVISIIYCLRKCCGDTFFSEIVSLGIIFVKLSTVAYLIFALPGRNPTDFLLLGNINNFGCMLCIGVALILVDRRKRILSKLFWIILLLAILLYNDSKLALLGAVFIIMLYCFYFILTHTSKRERFLIKGILIVVCVVAVGIVISGDLVINGYNISRIPGEVWGKIKNGEFYNHSSSSLAFRTNAIVGLVKIMRESWFVGVGFGNSGLILKSMLPDIYESLQSSSYVSSHIWWLEVMSDAGIIVIFLAVKYYIKHLYAFWRLKISASQIFSCLVIISFPLWCMSASGLYTEFFSISMLAAAVAMLDNRVVEPPATKGYKITL